MTRLRQLRAQLICRLFGHRGLYWWQLHDQAGDTCQRCDQPLWEEVGT